MACVCFIYLDHYFSARVGRSQQKIEPLGGGGWGGRVKVISGGLRLRSKRSRRAFRPLEAFFAFWLRKNWGERNTDGSSGEGEGRQKSEKCIERAESLTKTLAMQARVD